MVIQMQGQLCDRLGCDAAGGPLQFSGNDAPEVAGYARYPAIDYYDVFDEGFKAGCPVRSKNFSAYDLEVKLPPEEWHTHFCWVIGTLEVRLSALRCYQICCCSVRHVQPCLHPRMRPHVKLPLIRSFQVLLSSRRHSISKRW